LESAKAKGRSHVFSKNKNAATGLWKKPGGGKRGKPKSGFPPFPPPLEIAHNPRDFHFSHSPDCCCWYFNEPDN
jgi:hypothetical protein